MVTFTAEQARVVMDLYNGELHQLGATDLQAYRRMRYVRHRIVMNTEGFDFERTNENALSRGDREMSVSDLRHQVDSLEEANDAVQKQGPRSEEHTSELQSHRDLHFSLHDALPISISSARPTSRRIAGCAMCGTGSS